MIDIEIFTERITAAVKARRNPDFLIIARTDARNAAQFGGREVGEQAFEGVKGLKAALEAGADCAFMESPRGKEACSRLVKALDGKPVLINVLPDVRVISPFVCIWMAAHRPVGSYWKSDNHRLYEFGIQAGNLSLHGVHPFYSRYTALIQDAQTGGFRSRGM